MSIDELEHYWLVTVTCQLHLKNKSKGTCPGCKYSMKNEKMAYVEDRKLYVSGIIEHSATMFNKLLS